MSALASIFIALALLAQQAQQPPVFRSGVQVVEVDARVFDRDGRFVTTLRADDFEILEDGVPQTIVAMTLVGAQRAAAPGAQEIVAPPAAVGQTGNRQPTTGNRQTWIFFFDLQHLTPGGGFDRAKKAVEEFIAERFREGDLAGVILGDTMVNNRLTSQRAELLQAVRGVKPLADHRNRMLELMREWPRFRDEGEAMEVARNNREAIQRVRLRACTEQDCGMMDPELAIREKGRRFAVEMQNATLLTLKTLNGLASGLAKMPGPKTIVFLSDGFVAETQETTLRSIVGQTARAGARVYAIDVRGLSRGMGASVDAPTAEAPGSAPPGFDALADGVNSLAIDTGGMMIRNENNIGRALDTVAADTSTYYVLGYQPANTNFDGKYRKIEIRVKRQALRVRARQGYLALEPSKMLIPQSIIKDQQPEAPAPIAPTSPSEPTPPPSTVPTVPTRTHVPTTALNVGRLRDLSGASASDLASRGWAAYERGDLEAALPLLEQAAARDDVRPWALYALGFTYVGHGRPKEAIAAWERVRAAEPGFAPVYLDLAATYGQMSEVTQALAVLREASARWPGNPDGHNGIGVLLVRRGAISEAIDAFTKATNAAPDDPLSWLNLGRAYELRYDRARRYDQQLQKWTGPEADRVKAEQSYKRCVALGGPYASQAADALARMAWS